MGIEDFEIKGKDVLIVSVKELHSLSCMLLSRHYQRDEEGDVFIPLGKVKHVPSQKEFFIIDMQEIVRLNKGVWPTEEGGWIQ